MTPTQAIEEIRSFLDYYGQSPTHDDKTAEALEVALEIMRDWLETCR